ncbi:Uma2 family endonuclease [Nostoc sp. LEGE 06077]|uniref:Uma2 family endonuclease n=1 Tax=Nostoc sp. LEGE 06077 TaxID=915325 RepID=UPI00187FF610|nr:Uma2 family endonuclease [Nostoc sp. LEGE 06077]MBE9210562.1 Uma2 family endonuclease [Nostoc sp. LEGE 06077]
MSISTAKRFTTSEYHRLTELGFFAEDDRVELIKGKIIEMAAKGTPHSVCETLLFRELIKLIDENALIRSQQPIIISDNSEPEPDLAIVRNVDDDYLSAHPSPSDVLLLIEVSDSSLEYDQETKLSIYAEARIPDYWIFNLVDNFLECYSEPYQSSQGQFGYRRKIIFLPNESVNLPRFNDLALDLSKVFPGV